MKCPKCKDQDLSKKDAGSPANCSKCGGMWLEYNALPVFMESIKSTPDVPTGSDLKDGRTGLCPSGHGIMIRAKVDVDNPFYLEKCTGCGGIWFDNGEWQRIRNLDLAENLNDLWCKSWQIKQRKEKDRQNYLETNRKLFGNQLFDQVMHLSELLKDHPEKGRAIALLQQEILQQGKE